MTTEEKAKAYDEALKIASFYYGNKHLDAEKLLEKLFPKLAEFEDERIRKEIIHYLGLVGKGDGDYAQPMIDRWIAYLEKQKHLLNFDAISSWLRDHASRYVNSEYNEFHHCTEYDGTINVERLIADLKVAVDSGTFDIHEQKEQKQGIKVRIPKFRVGDIIQRIPLEAWDSTKKITSIDEHGYNYNLSHLGDTVSGGAIGFAFEDEYELVEQKPAEKLSKEDYVKKFKALCDVYEIKLPNREYDIYHLCDDLSKLSIDSGKQKPVEVKPRFKIGDTLKKKNKDYTFVVDKIQGGFYLTSNEHFFPIEEQDSWELLEQKPAECLKAERDGWYMCIKDYYRGGKKQCSVGDLVQAKGGMYMMDGEDISEWFRKAYYDEIKTVEWNKATINGEPIPTENHSVNIPLAVWSEEDKKIVETICKEGDLKPSEKRWLKSLPERFNLQLKQEWSEEDEALFELLHQCVCRCINDDRMDYSERDKISKTMIPFIEKLQTLHPQQEWSEDNIKELTKFEVAMLHIGMSFFGSSAGLNPNNTNEVKKQAKLLLELVPKQDWSEEDEKMLADISWAIRHCAYNDKKKKQVHDWFENHLKSTHPQPHTVSIKDATKFGNLEYERGVKDGIQHAKNHQWKPSDEQMEALEWMLTTVTIKDGGKGVVLKNLVNDLKKQM